MKGKRITGILSVILAIAMLMTSFTFLSYAEKKDEPSEEELSSYEAVIEAASKEETVYIMADGTGTPEKIIVTDWIKNPKKADKIKDRSFLEKIENLGGDGSFVMDESGMMIWDTDGKDVHYRGESKEKLPVDIKVTYELDGKKIRPDRLKGKSGSLKIRFDYRNNRYENVAIDGINHKIYVPFVMMTGMVLDGEKFSDVEISSGKVISDGKKIIVTGFALPGLQENLDLSKDMVDIPSYVEVSANVNNFEMDTTITLCDNELFSKIDTEKVGSPEDIKEKLNQLNDASNQLVKGAGMLYGGLCQLAEGTSMVKSKADLIYGKKEYVSDTVKEINANVTYADETLNELALKLDETEKGIEELSPIDCKEMEEYFNHLLELFNEILKTAKAEGLDIGVDEITKDNYKEVLDLLYKSLTDERIQDMAEKKVKEDLEKYILAIESILSEDNDKNGDNSLNLDIDRDELSKKIKEELKKQAEEKIPSRVSQNDQVQKLASYLAKVPSLNEKYGGKEGIMQAMIDYAVNTAKEVIDRDIDTGLLTDNLLGSIFDGKNIDELKGKIDIDRLKELLSAKSIPDDIMDQLMKKKEIAEMIMENVRWFKEKRNMIPELVKTLDKYRQLTQSIEDRLPEIMNGFEMLKSGSEQLNTGTNMLRDGSKMLYDGMTMFDTLAIKKIVGEINGKVMPLAVRIKATCDVAKNYNNYSGKTEETEGSVRFVYKTDTYNVIDFGDGTEKDMEDAVEDLSDEELENLKKAIDKREK